MSDDIRWLQRFANYTKALQSLSEAVALAGERPLSKLEQQGIFALIGSRDASRSAFQNGLFTDGEAWMDMIKARNLTSHTYNPEVADSVTRDILVRFYPAFAALRQRLDSLTQPGFAP